MRIIFIFEIVHLKKQLYNFISFSAKKCSLPVYFFILNDQNCTCHAVVYFHCTGCWKIKLNTSVHSKRIKLHNILKPENRRLHTLMFGVCNVSRPKTSWLIEAFSKIPLLKLPFMSFTWRSIHALSFTKYKFRQQKFSRSPLQSV